MKIQHVNDDFYSLLERAALKDCTAAMAAEVAEEAERIGHTQAVARMERLAHRCSVRAQQLRGQAVAQKAREP